jgi:hypothetical protein
MRPAGAARFGAAAWFLLALTGRARANVAWEIYLFHPAFFSRTWWAVLVGLGMELMAVNWIINDTWRESLKVALLMNLISLSAGVALRLLTCEYLSGFRGGGMTMRVAYNLMQVFLISGAIEAGVVFGLLRKAYSPARLGLLLGVNMASLTVFAAALIGALRDVGPPR